MDQYAVLSLARCLLAIGELMLIAAAVLACSSGTKVTNSPSNAFTPTVALTAGELQGSWGLASFRNEADRARTEVEAKSACSKPYLVQAGNNGGVLMHLADQTQRQELYVKSDGKGQTFIGPKGQAGMRQDRLIASFDNNVLVTQWVDPAVAERFGTMIFVRCNAS